MTPLRQAFVDVVIIYIQCLTRPHYLRKRQLTLHNGPPLSNAPHNIRCYCVSIRMYFLTSAVAAAAAADIAAAAVAAIK